MKALRVAVTLVGVVGLVLVVPVVHRSPEDTLGGLDPRLLVLEVGAALALLVLAALAPPRLAAVLVAVVGAAWLVPELAGAVAVPMPARTISEATVPLLAGALLAGLVYSSGRVVADARSPVLLMLGAAVVATSARSLLVDPFDDEDCWRACDHNPLLLGDGTLGPWVWAVGITGMVAGVLWAARLRWTRRDLGPSATADGAADVAGWLLLVGLLISLAWPARDGRGLPVTVFVVVQATAFAWLAERLWETWLRWRLESRLARWAGLLGGRKDNEKLSSSLRAAVGDPSLRLAYWAPAREAYVDVDGHTTTATEPGPGERVTTVTRRGETISRIVHGRRVDGSRLERALGPSLRLALENEQLRAAALAELEELTRSRTRVVERAALERRRLERNLHDGAQQRAVSLALLVRLLTTRSADEQEMRGRAEALTRALTEELRRVARGIYPAVLTDAGLLGAVMDLAEGSTDVPVVVAEFPEGRYPGTIESTAYLVVRDALIDARRRGATRTTVSGSRDDGILSLRVEDDALVAPEETAMELADQVSALGGELVTIKEPGVHRVEVVLPCVS